MPKPYARLAFTAAEFARVHSAVITSRATMCAQAKTTTGDERAFYFARMDEFDALLAKFEAVLVGDTSQDAEPDDDEEEDEM